MKLSLLYPTLLVVITSCSTVYQSGQTPDDVYFSPAVSRTHSQNHKKQNTEEEEQIEEYNSYSNDRYLRMRVHHRSRWSDFDDYYSDPYAYSYQGCYCNCAVNPRLYWNYHYSPYAQSVVILNPHSPVYNKPRVFNLDTYHPNQTNNFKEHTYQTRRTYQRPVLTNSSSDNSGNTLRDIFRTSDNGSPKSNNSSSGSDNSSGSSSTNHGHAPVRRF